MAAINYIHSIGICHRDLKPENLLIDYDGCLKMVDFGLSNQYPPGEKLKTACGSPCYAAPEVRKSFSKMCIDDCWIEVLWADVRLMELWCCSVCYVVWVSSL